MAGRKKTEISGKKQPYKRRYSVYRRQTDEPIMINGTADECANAMGITRNSFYKYMVRTEYGTTGRKYEVFVDDPDEEMEESLCF